MPDSARIVEMRRYARVEHDRERVSGSKLVAASPPVNTLASALQYQGLRVAANNLATRTLADRPGAPTPSR
jgi:hypothetical protein